MKSFSTLIIALALPSLTLAQIGPTFILHTSVR